MVLHHESFQKIYKLVPRYHQYVLWKKSKFEIKALDENKILQFCFENLNAHSNPLSYNLKIMKVLDHSVENCIFVKNCFSCSLLPIFSHIYFSHRFTFLQYKICIWSRFNYSHKLELKLWYKSICCFNNTNLELLVFQIKTWKRIWIQTLRLCSIYFLLNVAFLQDINNLFLFGFAVFLLDQCQPGPLKLVLWVIIGCLVGCLVGWVVGWLVGNEVSQKWPKGFFWFFSWS